MAKIVSQNADYKNISEIKNIFMNSAMKDWIKYTGNFSMDMGKSAKDLLNFINSNHVESIYKYSGIDFDDFQRALSIILKNYDKIERISQTYDWHYVCENINKCAYLVFIWNLWTYIDRDSNIRQIYINAKKGNKYAQNILNIDKICKWKDWSSVLNTDEESYSSSVYTLLTDIIKRIQYPKMLNDIDKSYAINNIKKFINYYYTCRQINIIVCYAYNNNLIGSLSTCEVTEDSYTYSNVYEYKQDVCWFNPPKPSEKKILLYGTFQLDNSE